jgi:hypothetical protein
MDPDEAERRFAELLAEAGLPPFVSSCYDPELGELELTWDDGLTLHIDLTVTDELSPIDDWERAMIAGESPDCGCPGPTHGP